VILLSPSTPGSGSLGSLTSETPAAAATKNFARNYFYRRGIIQVT